MSNKNLENIKKKYLSAFKIHGDSELSLMWSKSGQKERLEALTSHLNINKNSTILDYGCGLSHLKLYLENKNLTFKYHGVDIVDDFVMHNIEKFTSFNTKYTTIAGFKDITENYDYIFISGVFNTLMFDTPAEQFKYIASALIYLFSKTDTCLSVNFMSTDVDYISEGSYHQNVNEIYNFAVENLSKRLIIDQSYMPYEFTLKIYKNDGKIQNIYREII